MPGDRGWSRSSSEFLHLWSLLGSRFLFLGVYGYQVLVVTALSLTYLRVGTKSVVFGDNLGSPFLLIWNLWVSPFSPLVERVTHLDHTQLSYS